MAFLNNFIKSTDNLVEFEGIFNQIDEKTHSQHTLVVYLDEIKKKKNIYYKLIICIFHGVKYN